MLQKIIFDFQLLLLLLRQASEWPTFLYDQDFIATCCLGMISFCIFMWTKQWLYGLFFFNESENKP